MTIKITSKLDSRIKEKLRRAIAKRLQTSINWAKSVDDPDCVEAVCLIKKSVAAERNLEKIMEEI